MNKPLLPARVIVDRTVLVELLSDALEVADGTDSDLRRGDSIERLYGEVASGERSELYERDWPMRMDK